MIHLLREEVINVYFERERRSIIFLAAQLYRYVVAAALQVEPHPDNQQLGHEAWRHAEEFVNPKFNVWRDEMSATMSGTVPADAVAAMIIELHLSFRKLLLADASDYLTPVGKAKL